MNGIPTQKVRFLLEALQPDKRKKLELSMFSRAQQAAKKIARTCSISLNSSRARDSDDFGNNESQIRDMAALKMNLLARFSGRSKP
jgi:hypothetical protein